MKVFYSAFLFIKFVFIIFWQKEIGTKAASKLLMQLTTVGVKNRIFTVNKTSRRKNEFLGNGAGPRARTANILASTCTSHQEYPRVRAFGTPNPTSLLHEYLSSL